MEIDKDIVKTKLFSIWLYIRFTVIFFFVSYKYSPFLAQ